MGECLVFSVVWGICYLRERLSRRLKVGTAAGIRGGAGVAGGEGIDEWEEIDRPGTPEV